MAGDYRLFAAVALIEAVLFVGWVLLALLFALGVSWLIKRDDRHGPGN